MSNQLTTKAEAGADDKRSSKPSTGGRGYNARAGETIAGNLARGGDGKFTSAGNAAAKKPTGQRAVDLQRRTRKPPKGRAAAKPRKGPKGPDPAKAAAREQRRREAEARRAQRQQDKLDRAVEADKKKRQQLADRETRADAQAKRRAEVVARRAQAAMDKLKREQAPKGGGGGKGGSAKPKPKPDAPDKAAEAAANRATVARALGQDLDTLADLADGMEPDGPAADKLISAGLAERQTDGSLTTTATGRSLIRAAERGDERQARAFLSRARELEARQAERERKKKPVAPPPRQTYGQRFRSFAVYKDQTSGRLRWLAVSSTAFKDRDGEIVSVAALQKDVARSDARGDYGPLRWWHVPGLDIGDCDFRAVHGRSLIESGTFRDDRYAAAIKAKDEVSLGFLHPLPDRTDGPVFDDIFTFERSVVPFPEGRGSNLFTRLVVKEAQMLTQAKRDALASRVGPDILAELLSQVEATEKAADQAGVAYKSAQRVAVWDEAAGAWSEVVAKAETLPPEIAADAKAEGDLTVDEEIIEEEPADDLVDTALLTPEELAEITQAVAPAVAQAVVEMLMPALNMEAKMSKWADEVKAAMGGAVAQKDTERAAQIETLKTEAATLKAAQEQTAARLAELTGDQPRAAGFRPSQADSTLVNPGHALKDAQPQVVTNLVDFFGIGQPA